MTRRATCESCKALDIRQLQQGNLLVPGFLFGWTWSRDDEPSGSICIVTEHDAIVLMYRYGTSTWKKIAQRVPITWTDCPLGGRRPWFKCDVLSGGKRCGRRVAKLYAAGELFACRHCYGLAYDSQRQNPQTRATLQLQKILMKLGGSGHLADPFPEKPPRMHWRTYRRLCDRALAAETNVDDMFLQKAERFIRKPVHHRRIRRAYWPIDPSARRMKAIFHRWRRG